MTKPLYNLRVAPYYGCLIVRPAFDGAYDDPEYPTSLDKLMQALGATVVDYPVKAHCCGGHMTQISEPVALDLIRPSAEKCRRLRSRCDRHALPDVPAESGRLSGQCQQVLRHRTTTSRSSTSPS